MMWSYKRINVKECLGKVSARSEQECNRTLLSGQPEHELTALPSSSTKLNEAITQNQFQIALACTIISVQVFNSPREAECLRASLKTFLKLIYSLHAILKFSILYSLHAILNFAVPKL